MCPQPRALQCRGDGAANTPSSETPAHPSRTKQTGMTSTPADSRPRTTSWAIRYTKTAINTPDARDSEIAMNGGTPPATHRKMTEPEITAETDHNKGQSAIEQGFFTCQQTEDITECSRFRNRRPQSRTSSFHTAPLRIPLEHSRLNKPCHYCVSHLQSASPQLSTINRKSEFVYLAERYKAWVRANNSVKIILSPAVQFQAHNRYC